MKHASELIKDFESEQYNELLTDIYVDEHLLAYQNGRYIAALQEFIKDFGDTEVSIFSAPGRSEVGGNHTDHQHGQVLAASINLDAIAIVAKTSDDKIQVISDGYDLITIDASDLSLVESEKETTMALIKGVAAGLKEHGHAVGGFKAYITSDVLIGAGQYITGDIRSEPSCRDFIIMVPYLQSRLRSSASMQKMYTSESLAV